MLGKCRLLMAAGLALSAYAAVGCGGDKSSINEQPPPGDAELGALALPPTVTVNNDKFATSQVCAECHTNSTDSAAMRDEQDREIGFNDLWQGTMMANSARDPLWRAVVSAEIAATPTRKDVIEEKCSRCHAPAGNVDAYLEDEIPSLDMLTAVTDRGNLARDGVTCTVCHQIEPDGLGTPESFSGGFVIDAVGKIYGPHDDNFTMPMENHTGFTPEYAPHTTNSELCASCHTLFTNALAPNGDILEEQLPEQTPYLEWQNSVFSTTELASCQDCHVPTTSEDGVTLDTMVARKPDGTDFPPVAERSPYGRHLFVGGNTWIPAVLRDFADILNPLATDAAFDQTIASAREQLKTATATAEIQQAERNGTALSFAVRLENKSGHKFPTGIPLRRAWLEVVVKDTSGAPVFASGRADASGQLIDGNDQVLAAEQVGGPALPHFDRITSEDQVYVLEALMKDPDGNSTYTLLRATGYSKDNRLLPRGWSNEHPEIAAMAALGVGDDADFIGGGDIVHYEVTVPASGALSIEVRLLYQPLSARFAAELYKWDTAEIRAFKAMLAATNPQAELVAEASAQVE